VLSVALWVAGCSTVPLEQQPWTLVETEHFEILSDAGPERSVELAREFEAFHSFMQAVVELERFEPAIPTRVFYFTSGSTYRRFGPPRSAGYFLATPSANYVVVGEIASLSATTVAFHEYSHYIMRSAGLFANPIWFDEGHADFVSTVRIRDVRLELGRVPRDRIDALLALGPMPLKRVVTAEGFARWGEDDVARLYAQSWAFVHYLYFSRENGEAVRWAQKDRFLSLAGGGMPIDEAFEQAFGMSFISMERELTAYFRQRVPVLVLSAERFLTAAPPRVRDATQADVARRLSRLALAGGRFELAEGMLERADAVEPDHPLTLALRAGALAARGSTADAERLYKRAIERAPSDARIRVAYGNLLASRAIRRAADFSVVAAPEQREAWLSMARAEYRRAIELDPRAPEAHAQLGFSYLLPGDDAAQAVIHADAAFARLSSDVVIAVQLAEALVAARRGSEALPILTRLLPYAARLEGAAAYLERLIVTAEAQGERVGP
jgi:Flp pilus assembly protein TadD